MATIHGKEADITATNYDANAHAWTLDVVSDVAEDTNWDWATADEEWKSFIAGCKSWTGSFECYLDSSLATSILPGNTVTLSLYVNNDTGVGFSGSCIISNISPDVDINGIQTLSVDYQGTGAITIIP